MHFHTTFSVYRSTSPQAAQFHKEVIYESDKHDLTHANRNNQHQFENGQNIVCRHLSLRVIMDVLFNPLGKLDMNNFGEESIESHIHADSEAIYNNRYKMADHPKIIDNTRLGANLCAVFEQMERTGQTVGAAFLESPSHSMAVRLRIKTDTSTGEKKYVISFYDPNRTSSLVRMAETVSTGLTNLRSLSTADIMGKEADDFYFKDSNSALLIPIDREKLAAVMDCVSKNIPVQLPAPDKVDIDNSVDTLHPHFIYHLMDGQFHQNIIQIARDFKELGLDKTDPERLQKIVEGYGDLEDNFALGAAMDGNNSRDSFEVYSELFRLLPENRRADLLTKITFEKFSQCLALGDSGFVRGFKTLLDMVPLKDRHKVLSAVCDVQVTFRTSDSDGSMLTSQRNGLEVAMELGKPDSVLAFAQLCASTFETLPDDLQPHPKVLRTTIQQAFRNKDIAMIKACLALLKQMPAGLRNKLISDLDMSAITTAFSPGISRSYRSGYASKRSGADQMPLIEQHIELMSLLPAPLRAKQIAAVLKPLKGSALFSMIPGAVPAMKKMIGLLPESEGAELLTGLVDGRVDCAVLSGHAGAIDLFNEKLNSQPPQSQVKFLVDHLAEPLRNAIKSGNADFIQSCRHVLAALPLSRRAEALEKLTGSSFDSALERNVTKSILAYAELLALTAPEQRKTVLANVTRLGLEHAFGNNNPEAIKAYGPLLELVSADERGDLLSHVVRGGPESALTDGHHRTITAFGTLLKSVPVAHLKVACLPAEGHRKNSLFSAFNAANSITKSTFLGMLGEVNVALVDHFIEGRNAHELEYGETGLAT